MMKIDRLASRYTTPRVKTPVARSPDSKHAWKEKRRMKHEFPKWDEVKQEWIKGPTAPPKKSGPQRGPKRPGPKTQCHRCGAWFFSRKQVSRHIQLSHRNKPLVLDEYGMYVAA